MSLVTKAIGIAKKIKHSRQEKSENEKNAYLSPVRRIERVKTGERVCAMTFDDGPCRLPPSQGSGDKPLTLVLLETLEKYGARGTFDVVGDTGANYPDKAGKEGGAEWGGIKYDHYPDIKKDSDGGAVNCPELIERILKGGHEITNHTYSHVLFGRKNIVYGRRSHMRGISKVIEDLSRLHIYMRDSFNYEMKLSRPPHYVDSTVDGFSAYDAYAALGYQYMAASYDGAGWLPLGSYADEVEAMWTGMETKLREDPDFFCGQIIFQKDGYNMARRTPVADGLEIQLELLKKYGYRVITVSEMMEMSPFRDLSSSDKYFSEAVGLVDRGMCICYRDNTIRPENPVTRGELAMMVYGADAEKDRLIKKPKGFKDMAAGHPYAGAAEIAVENGALELSEGRFNAQRNITKNEFERFCSVSFGKEAALDGVLNHGNVITALDRMYFKDKQTI